MANENFGLGFTVEPLAEWNDTEGGMGSAGTVFADIASLYAFGPAGTVFADIVAYSGMGSAGTISASGLCAVHNMLQGPGQSILDSAGGSSNSILSCP